MTTINHNYDGSKVFFTSDTHFNHANIIRYCNRPFKNVDDMNETLIANWNSVVGVDDDVFHLGDFCLGGADEWTKMLDRLNGRMTSGNSLDTSTLARTIQVSMPIVCGTSIQPNMTLVLITTISHLCLITRCAR